jgi:uncharacterized Zn finger protein (UPF0148 family)
VRVECESCRQLFAASFGVSRDAVRATCPACRHEMMAPVAARGALLRDTIDPNDGSTLCPKCGTPRGEAGACATCGLAVTRMAAYREERDAAVPASVRDAWQHATGDWNDLARHDELLRQVAVHHSYAWVASRYRTRRDDIAQRQLERLRRAAEATLFASATVRPDEATKPYRAARGVLLILIVAVVIGIAYAMVMRERAPAARPPEIPVRPLQPGHPVSPSTMK